MVSRSSDHAKIILGEPALEDVHVVEGLGSPLELSFLKGVFRDTETDKFSIFDVVGDLGINSSSDSVIISILVNGTTMFSLLTM